MKTKTRVFNHISLSADKNCRENRKTHFMFDDISQKLFRVLDSVQNIVQKDGPQITIRGMRVTCCIPKATTHTHRICNIFAFPRQQWLHEPASKLRYKYIASLLNITSINFLLQVVKEYCLLNHANEFRLKNLL
jgi:hypothetical protein